MKADEVINCRIEEIYECGGRIILEEESIHLVVDTLGLINIADVHSASIQDRDGALDLFVQAKEKTSTLQRFFADQGYTGNLQNQCLLSTGCPLTIAKKSHRVSGYSKALDSRKNFCMAFKF